MYLSLLVFPLLLPTAQSACINCGGADKTSAKRLKMPNKSVFTRLAGIELMEIFEITNQINHEVCAQQCDAHTECAVFEFNLPNKLCVLASEYARLSDDLAKGAFKTIVFVKVRGKFTKAMPKEKETCLDKSEYEDYVKHEVDKWLNPSPKKSTSAPGSSSASLTTVSAPATTGTSAATAASSGTTTTAAGGTSGASTTTTSSASTSPQTSTVVPEETTTSGASTSSLGQSSSSTTSPATTTTVATPPAAAPTTVTTTGPLVDTSPSSTTTARSDTSVAHSSTTVTKKDPNGWKTSTPRSTQSTTTSQGSTTTEDPSTTTEISTPDEDQSTSEPTLSSTEPTTTTVDKVSTTTAAKDPPVLKDPVGQWRLRSVEYGKYLRASNGSVDLAEAGEDFEQWDIQKSGFDLVSQFELKSMNNTSKWLYLRASEDRLPKASSDDKLAVNLTDVHEAYEHWGATKNDDSSWSFMSFNLRWLSTNGTVVYTVPSTLFAEPSSSERFVLESL